MHLNVIETLLKCFFVHFLWAGHEMRKQLQNDNTKISLWEG